MNSSLSNTVSSSSVNAYQIIHLDNLSYFKGRTFEKTQKIISPRAGTEIGSRLFETKDTFFNISNFLEWKDLIECRPVCTQALSLFNTFQEKDTIWKFWNRTLVEVFPHELMGEKNRITQGKFKFSTDFHLNFSVPLKNLYAKQTFLQFIQTTKNSENSANSCLEALKIATLTIFESDNYYGKILLAVSLCLVLKNLVFVKVINLQPSSIQSSTSTSILSSEKSSLYAIARNM